MKSASSHRLRRKWIIPRSEIFICVFEVLVSISSSLFDALCTLEVTARPKAFLNFQLATRALSLLVDVELELVLLLLDQLLSYLLLLDKLGFELLVLLKGFNMMYCSFCVQPHQSLID